MPSADLVDGPLSVLPNSANSSQRDPSSIEIPRKSHDKTISSVFTYTNGTDVETGLPDHRLEQVKGLKNNDLQKSGTNGLITNKPTKEINGVAKSADSAALGDVASQPSGSAVPSTRAASYISTTEKVQEGSGSVTESGRGSTSLDGYVKHSIADKGADQKLNWPLMDDAVDLQKPAPELNKSQSEAEPFAQRTLQHYAPSSSGSNVKADGQSSAPSSSRQNNVHRFSSPTTPSETLLPEAPRLVQRHTLQVPRVSSSLHRDSRDLPFNTGDDALTATGRFSPARDSTDTSTVRHRRASLGLVRRVTRSMASDAQLDEVLPDDDAARWTEIVKQKRASRRKRKEEEEDDERVVVGKKVEEGHVNWVIAYNMLTGIRFTVSRTNAKMDRELTDADFDTKHKFSFDVTGNELTPSAKYDFKFKDYSPWVFRHLRARFGLDPADYLMSLTSKYILSELGSPGKSGSFFYFSRDYKYIIKTIHHAEHKLLRKILRDYYAHVRDNPNTLISQFYGLHRVKIPYGRKIHFVVMNNLFPPHRDIHQTFDLKGSTIGRDFKEDDLESNPRATLKDLNWLRRDLHLEFQDQIKKAFVEQITKDVRLLQKLHIMDYSLLVGMHDLEKGNEENVRETTLQVFQPGGERDEEEIERANMLVRTPSRLENARKARELRQTLKKEKPTPMSLVTAKMPDKMKSSDMRQYKLFYSDDGGIRATHEDGTGGDQVYYLGVIDCLTHYGFIKRVEHFWKGMSSPRTQISPIPPEAYGERFINFITGITMTKEEAERRKTMDGSERASVDAHNALHHHHIPTQIDTGMDGAQQSEKSPTIPATGNQEAVERTMEKAQKQADKSTGGKDRKSSESEVPDRELKTVTVPDGESSQARNSTTLPVVEEVGEGTSDISRSNSKEPETSSPSQSRTSEAQPWSSSISEQHSLDNTQKQITDRERMSSAQSGDEQFHSPAEYMEESRDQIKAAFKPIPSFTNEQDLNSKSGPSRDKPPRLGSGLIPHLAPISPLYDGNDHSDVGRAV